MKNRKKKNSDAMLLTLCARCAAQFYNSDEHIVHRANLDQKYKEPCCYCSCRLGWDYKIQRRVKS